MSRVIGAAGAALAILAIAACSKQTPTSPTPPADGPIANAYILPGAVNLGANAFGDEPVVIHKGERLRWRNIDTVEHDIVADTASLPEFVTTGTLAPGSERVFTMNTLGTTKIHCTIHPQMMGTLVVQESLTSADMSVQSVANGRQFPALWINSGRDPSGPEMSRLGMVHR